MNKKIFDGDLYAVFDGYDKGDYAYDVCLEKLKGVVEVIPTVIGSKLFYYDLNELLIEFMDKTDMAIEDAVKKVYALIRKYSLAANNVLEEGKLYALGTTIVLCSKMDGMSMMFSGVVVASDNPHFYPLGMFAENWLAILAVEHDKPVTIDNKNWMDNI